MRTFEPREDEEERELNSYIPKVCNTISVPNDVQADTWWTWCYTLSLIGALLHAVWEKYGASPTNTTSPLSDTCNLPAELRLDYFEQLCEECATAFFN